MRLRVAGGGQDKQLQPLLQQAAAGCTGSGEAKCSPKQKGAVSPHRYSRGEQFLYCRQPDCTLATGELGFGVFLFLQLSLKLAMEEKQRILWVLLTFAPPHTEHTAFIQAPHSFGKTEHREGHRSGVFPSVLLFTTSLLHSRWQRARCSTGNTFSSICPLTHRLLPCNKLCFLLSERRPPKPLQSKTCNVTHTNSRSDSLRKDCLRDSTHVTLTTSK